ADRELDPRGRRQAGVAHPSSGALSPPGGLPPPITPAKVTVTVSPRLMAVFGAGFWLSTTAVGSMLPVVFILSPAWSSAQFACCWFRPVGSGTVVPLPLLVNTRIVVPRPAWPDGSVPETVPAGRSESC